MVVTFFCKLCQTYRALLFLVVFGGAGAEFVALFLLGEEIFYFGESCLHSTHLHLNFKGLSFALAEDEASEYQECKEDYGVEHDPYTQHKVGNEPPLTVAFRPLVSHDLGVGLRPHSYEAPNLNEDIRHVQDGRPLFHALKPLLYINHRRMQLHYQPLQVGDLLLILLGQLAVGSGMLEFHSLDPNVINKVNPVLLYRHVAPYRECRHQVHRKMDHVLADVDVYIIIRLHWDACVEVFAEISEVAVPILILINSPNRPKEYQHQQNLKHREQNRIQLQFTHFIILVFVEVVTVFAAPYAIPKAIVAIFTINFAIDGSGQRHVGFFGADEVELLIIRLIL